MTCSKIKKNSGFVKISCASWPAPASPSFLPMGSVTSNSPKNSTGGALGCADAINQPESGTAGGLGWAEANKQPYGGAEIIRK